MPAHGSGPMWIASRSEHFRNSAARHRARRVRWVKIWPATGTAVSSSSVPVHAQREGMRDALPGTEGGAAFRSRSVWSARSNVMRRNNIALAAVRFPLHLIVLQCSNCRRSTRNYVMSPSQQTFALNQPTSNSLLRFPAIRPRRPPLARPRRASVPDERTILAVLNRRVEVIGARVPTVSPQ